MTHDCPDLQKMCQRVREKSVSYEQYNFTCYFDDFLKAFFDLAQEYDSLSDFYRICVAVPLEMFNISSALYLYDEKDEELHLVCDCQEGVQLKKMAAPKEIVLCGESYRTGDSYVMPIWSKAQREPDAPPEEDTRDKPQHCPNPGRLHGKNRLLGMYSVSPYAKLSKNDLFFFSKYTNRIGYSLHNRLMALQNIEHLKFINTLVMDIEHNVIVPNMYFRHLFNKLKKNITELETLREDIRKTTADGGADAAACLARCAALQEGLMYHHGELVKHHQNISLFLESLFRREHFESGRLVLHPKRCFVEKEIILPQLEHYDSRFRSASITVERPGNMLEEEFQLVVDIGLLSQVYANLFSNAAKYTREIITQDGRPRKALAYGREMVRDFPESGEQGVKFNVFSTGPHLDKDEARHIFQEGVRGKDALGIHGTGHGLSFVQHVVELHGGIVGYEPTPEGNNFYFILPVVSADE